MKNRKQNKKIIEDLNKKYKTWLLYLIIIFSSLFVFLIFTFEAIRVNENKANDMLINYPPYSYDGSTFVTETYPIMRDVVFVGDSYTHFLSLDLGFDTISFSKPGYTVDMLTETFEEAFKTKKKYLVIFIGPNDFNKGNTPEEMYEALRRNIYAYKYKVNGTVILCTYLPSLHTNDMEKKYPNSVIPIEKYNEQILRLVNEKKRIYYLDLSETANKEEYYKYNNGELDTVHLNYDFNIYFINKLYSLLIKIVRNGH